MKILIIALLLYGQVRVHNVIFKDSRTKETLVGVRVVGPVGTSYSGFDGGCYISDTVKVSYIAYKDTVLAPKDSLQVIYLTLVE
jgi:hypothetical protein